MKENNSSSEQLVDAPILNLLQASPTQMTPDQLRNSIAKLREVATSKQTALKSLEEEAGGKTRRKKSVSKSEDQDSEENAQTTKVKAADLALKYLGKKS